MNPIKTHARALRVGAVAAAMVLMAGLAVPAGAAVSPGAAPGASAITMAAPRVPALHWHACDDGFQCATARVPLDYRHPRGALISIAVIRHLATGSGRPVGSLFVNGGGPGEQIQGFVAEYPAIPAVLRERFDLITFDPRGFGFSSPVQCFLSIAAENKLLAPVEPYPTFPVGTRQTQVFERTYASFGTQCARQAGVLLDHDTTADVARDMNLLREAVGARQLNYIGLSYGTGLGAIYANLFPAAAGRMVLDGNLNPVAWTSGGTVSSWRSAAAQLQQLWLATSAHAASAPRPASIQPATGAAHPYEGLEQAIAVLCSDTADPRNVRDYLAAARAGSRYGGFGELAAWTEAPCASWPVVTEQDRYTGPWKRPTAGTILVIGNTGDPTTPYLDSVAMARDLARARLLTVNGFGHTEFFNPSECASNYEFRYLTTGALPPQGTICQQSVQPF